MASPKGRRKGGYSVTKDVNAAKAEMARGHSIELYETMGNGTGRHRSPAGPTAVDHRKPHALHTDNMVGSYGVRGMYYSRSDHFSAGQGD